MRFKVIWGYVRLWGSGFRGLGEDQGHDRINKTLRAGCSLEFTWRSCWAQGKHGEPCWLQRAWPPHANMKVMLFWLLRVLETAYSAT